MEKKIYNRISYLEKLRHEHGELTPEEAQNFQSQIDEQHALLKSLQKQESRWEEWTPSETDSLPTPASGVSAIETHSVNGHLDSHLAPLNQIDPQSEKEPVKLYIPPKDTLFKWRLEAKECSESYGDRNDHPRRVLVLLESLHELLNALEQHGIAIETVSKYADLEEKDLDRDK